MKRKIISINESLCNGCGDCITGCAEGALEIINGKARLVKESYCDGFGDCIGHCPTGALSISEREANEFNLDETKDYLLRKRGQEAVWHMMQSQEKHNQSKKAFSKKSFSCPGSKEKVISSQSFHQASTNYVSELRQWPIQLHLVQPRSTLFNDKELVVLSTCSPVASPNVHGNFIKNRSVVVACPKLDRTDPYIEKLAEIFKNKSIPKALIVRMEVPCCGGLTRMVSEAKQLSGRDDLVVEEHIIKIEK